MRILIRNVFTAVVINMVVAIAGPYVENALFVQRLLSMHAPTALRLPVDSVQLISLRDSWHAPREGGRRRHEGIDIFAPRGTPVRATAAGVVLHVGTSARGGKVVWVLGPGGQRHYYAHLERFAHVYTGMRVEAGTMLGHVGTSGNAAGTPPHLHYGIYTRAGAINPYPLLQAGSAEAGS